MIYQNKLQCIRLVHATTNLFKISKQKKQSNLFKFSGLPQPLVKNFVSNKLRYRWSNRLIFKFHPNAAPSTVITKTYTSDKKNRMHPYSLNHCMKFCIIKIGKNCLECITVLAVTANCRHMQVQNMTFNSCSLQLQIFYILVVSQCFDAVGWAAGSAVKNSVVGCWHGYLSGARCRLAYDPADATATHCLLLQ